MRLYHIAFGVQSIQCRAPASAYHQPPPARPVSFTSPLQPAKPDSQVASRKFCQPSCLIVPSKYPPALRLPPPPPWTPPPRQKKKKKLGCKSILSCMIRSLSLSLPPSGRLAFARLLFLTPLVCFYTVFPPTATLTSLFAIVPRDSCSADRWPHIPWPGVSYWRLWFSTVSFTHFLQPSHELARAKTGGGGQR